MAGPLIPPRYVNVPSKIIYDGAVQPAIRDTYVQLRGLAWGKEETPPLSMEQLINILHKSRATIFGHLKSLRDQGWLQFSTAQAHTMIVQFIDDPMDEKESRNLDSINPVNHELNIKSLRESFTKTPAVQKSGQSRKLDKSTVPVGLLRGMADAILEVTGIDKKLNFSRAAKEAKDLISAGYSPDQIRKVYGQGGTWYSKDWRGQKGEVPQIGLIRSTIAQLLTAKPGNNGSHPTLQSQTEEETRTLFNALLDSD